MLQVDPFFVCTELLKRNINSLSSVQQKRFINTIHSVLRVCSSALLKSSKCSSTSLTVLTDKQMIRFKHEKYSPVCCL